MDPAQIIQVENRHDSHQFNKKIPIKEGRGAVLVDHDGNEYIDCMGGHGVAVLGYSHPRINKAIKNFLDAGRPITCGHFYDEDRAKLFKQLVGLTPSRLNRVFLGNSGTEAVEAALKLAMKWHKDKPEKEIIAFKRGFHGRTLGALSATFEPRYRKDYTLLSGFKHASYNDADSVKKLVNDNTVAIILELVQGEGGVFPADEGFPAELREICDENGIALIFDEVQTGFGRTGKMFALEHYGVEPDILCLAKGIAGGIPMSATITTDEIMDAMTPGGHGTTFGGNPFACAVASESLRIIQEERLLDHAMEMSKLLFNGLNEVANKSNVVREIRGKGLMIGIQCRKIVKDYLRKLQEHGVLALNAGQTVVRLLPPLVITRDQVLMVLDAIKDVLVE